MELYSTYLPEKGGVGTEKDDHLPEPLIPADGSRELRAREIISP